MSFILWWGEWVCTSRRARHVQGDILLSSTRTFAPIVSVFDTLAIILSIVQRVKIWMLNSENFSFYPRQLEEGSFEWILQKLSTASISFKTQDVERESLAAKLPLFAVYMGQLKGLIM